MGFRRSVLAPAVAVTGVGVPAAILLETRGPVEALWMIALVAVLVGMYLLRRYARAELLYRHLPSHGRHLAERAGADHRSRRSAARRGPGKGPRRGRPASGRPASGRAASGRAASGRRPRPEGDNGTGGFTGDLVDEWGRQSFPASDPPANW